MAVVKSTSPPIPSDEQLLQRFADGETEILDELFERYQNLAYRIAFRLLNNEADALDAVQNGFIKALKNLPKFQGRSTFKTWFLRVISNSALDLGRQRTRKQTFSLSSDGAKHWEEISLSSSANPGQGLEREDLRNLLDFALATLSETHRQTFVLHAEAELSYREVSEVLGISIGTVMSRLYYARQKLRTVLSHWIPI